MPNKQEKTPGYYAKRLISKYCYNSPQEIDIIELLYAENLFLKYEPLDYCQAKIVFNKKHGIITLNRNIEEEYRQRFLIAHEMGHFYNERLLGNTQTRMEVNLNHNTENRKEARANAFASELLMHEPWFKEKVKGKKLDVSLLKDTADYFNVSFTAAAVRYSQIGFIPAALIMSKNGRVEWTSINEEFPFKFCPRNRSLSSETKAYNLFYRRNLNAKETLKTSGLVPAYAWFDDAYHYFTHLTEINIPMPRYSSVLTLLYEW